MELFATTQDMQDRSLGEITATSHPFLERELAAATRAIRDEARWHIAPVESITRRVARRDRHDIWVPAQAITAVTITTADGTVHELRDDEFDPETGWTAWSGDRYTLTYTAGYENPPEDIVTLTLEIAAAALGTSLGFTREQAGSVSVSYGRAGGGVLGNESRLTAYKLGRLP